MTDFMSHVGHEKCSGVEAEGWGWFGGVTRFSSEEVGASRRIDAGEEPAIGEVSWGRRPDATKSLSERVGLWLSGRGQLPDGGEGLGGSGWMWYPSTEAMNRCRLTIYYSGRVQGVGFRFTTKSVAAGYEVVGVVRNLADGRVELVVEGDREELEAFRRGIQDSEVGGLIRHEEEIGRASCRERV